MHFVNTTVYLLCDIVYEIKNVNITSIRPIFYISGMGGSPGDVSENPVT